MLLQFLVFLVVTASATEKSDKGGITGGWSCEVKDYPFMVSIQTDSAFHLCGGSVINHRWVLTAAHCYDPDYTLQLVVGSNKYDDVWTGQIYYIEKWVRHYRHDIALIHVTSAILQSDNVGYAKLWLSNSKNVRDELCRTGISLGWGIQTEYYAEGVVEGPHDHLLKCIEMDVQRPRRCTALKSRDDNYFCVMTRRPHSGHCMGDSGGPFLCGEYQVGIVATNHGGCGFAHIHGHYYTKIAMFTSWIINTVTKGGYPIWYPNSLGCSPFIDIRVLYLFQGVLMLPLLDICC